MTADSKLLTHEKAPNADEMQGKRADELTGEQLDQVSGGVRKAGDSDTGGGSIFLRFDFKN